MGNAFLKSKIYEMKKFFISNSKLPKGKKKVCIVTLNYGIKMLYDDMNMKLGSQIDLTMKNLKELGKIETEEIIEFKDANGKTTTGVVEPTSLSKSVYDFLLDLIGKEMGCFVFGLSIMDGYHSVTLILEKIDNKIECFWCDQNDGCIPVNKANLDKMITDKTIKWWKKNAELGTKMKTRTTIWLLRE